MTRCFFFFATAMLRAGARAAGRDLAVPDGARLRPGGQSASESGRTSSVRLCEISFSYRSKGRRLRERARGRVRPARVERVYGVVSGSKRPLQKLLLLLELCDDRGDGDDGPKAAKKAFHARCAYLANGAGARSLRKERWRARAVATARGATLHDYAVRDESGLLKPACSPDLRSLC